MAIKRNISDLSNLKRGSTDIEKVYRGSNLVWERTLPFIVTGGIINTYTKGGKNYKSHTFTSNGTLTVVGSGTFNILLVGSGKNGGDGIKYTNRYISGSGGQGGKFILYESQILNNNSYTVVIATSQNSSSLFGSLTSDNGISPSIPGVGGDSSSQSITGKSSSSNYSSINIGGVDIQYCRSGGSGGVQSSVGGSGGDSGGDGGGSTFNGSSAPPNRGGGGGGAGSPTPSNGTTRYGGSFGSGVVIVEYEVD